MLTVNYVYMLQFIIRWYPRFVSQLSAANIFSLFTGQCPLKSSFGHEFFTNCTGHTLLTNNTVKKITQDVLVRYSVIVSRHNAKSTGHFPNLVEQCPVTDCYSKHSNWTSDFSKIVLDVTPSGRTIYLRHTIKYKTRPTQERPPPM